MQVDRVFQMDDNEYYDLKDMLEQYANANGEDLSFSKKEILSKFGIYVY